MSQHKFVNRQEELAFLEQEYRSKKAAFVVLYGRRRVGKTELSLRFMRGKTGLYFLASTEGDMENISNFKAKVADLIKDPTFGKIEFKDWFSLFETLANNVNFLSLTRQSKVIICIDEFSYLIAANPAIPSIFQKIYDLVLNKLNIMLVLAGSSVSMMEEAVLRSKSPLYGRRTGQWFLQPLSFIFLKDFLNYNVEDLLNVWFVVGGIPEYLLKFDSALPFWDNVKAKILTKGTYLYDEAEVLLRAEFREPKNYKLIFKAIALGQTTLGEICSFTGLDKSMVSKYLDVLKNLYIIKEEKPVTASQKFKRRLYMLADPYFNFWFRYVYPNKIDLEAHRKEEILKKIKADWPNYASIMFERLVEELIRKKAFFKNIPWTRIGRWWYKDKEIDIIALNDEAREILFVECKWQDKVDAIQVLKKLKETARFVDWHKGIRKELYAIFAKSFKQKIEEKNIFCFDLHDIEKILK